MPSFDISALPTGPLSMAALVAMEPAPLRRLLKRGLRRGLSAQQLAELLEVDWQCHLDSPEASDLLNALERRGWLLRDGDHWKTRLG
jgi:hypothetical protein